MMVLGSFIPSRMRGGFKKVLVDVFVCASIGQKRRWGGALSRISASLRVTGFSPFSPVMDGGVFPSGGAPPHRPLVCCTAGAPPQAETLWGDSAGGGGSPQNLKKKKTRSGGGAAAG